MQNKMKTHSLNKEQSIALLNTVQTGSLATINTDGTPYVTPIHFAYHNNAIYIHGLPTGQKIENIKLNPTVCMTAFTMNNLKLDKEEKPCKTGTRYESVILSGKATIIDDLVAKKEGLEYIIAKYTPQLISKTMPENRIRNTAVIKIAIEEITGKYDL